MALCIIVNLVDLFTRYNAFGIKARSTVIVSNGKVAHVFAKVTPKGHATEILAKL